MIESNELTNEEIRMFAGHEDFPLQRSFIIIQLFHGIKEQMLLKGHSDKYIEKCNQLF